MIVIKMDYNRAMDDTITLLRERAADAFDRFYETAGALQQKYQVSDFPSDKEADVRKVYFEIGHDIRALQDTFELSLKTPESWQRFLTMEVSFGSLEVRRDHLARLPTLHPDLITQHDIKPLLDRLLVIQRLGEYGLKRMGMQDASRQADGVRGV